MRARLKKNQPSILILADFSDGSWHAASFALRFLFNDKSTLTLLQTYQNPNWGHLMMRKLSHHLKKITKNELRILKNRLLKHFQIENNKVNTLSVEGDLNKVLQFEPIINSPQNIVLSTLHSFHDSCKRQNGCLEKIIDTAKKPLFILPEAFEGEGPKKILFVGDPDKEPSEQLYRQVLEICQKTQSDLELLLVQKTQENEKSEALQAYYTEYFKEIDVTVKTIQHKTKCRGINNYLNHASRDLIVIENN